MTRAMLPFLSDRAQRVIYEGDCSDALGVTSGVPQGSILGPLLFSIYTSNFIKSLQHCKYHLYADDTQIYKSFAPDQADILNAQLNVDLDNLLSISNDHLLKISPGKSAALLFCCPLL